MHFLSTKFYTLARDSQEQVGAAFHSSSRGYAMARASHAASEAARASEAAALEDAIANAPVRHVAANADYATFQTSARGGRLASVQVEDRKQMPISRMGLAAALLGTVVALQAMLLLVPGLRTASQSSPEERSRVLVLLGNKVSYDSKKRNGKRRVAS